MLKTVILIPLIGGLLTLVPLQDSGAKKDSVEITRLIAVIASIVTFIYSM
jgi:NADH:ubiquinone oxidoreductase subunit 4 (subunit M)